jgi:hypothetical protein
MIDFERLAAWMDDQGLPGKGEPIQEKFLSGRSTRSVAATTRA